jgi:hypothetical protein
LDRNDFLRTVAQLPPTLFRAKGILEFTDSLQPAVFQYVAGRHDISVLTGPSIKGRFLTLIGKGGDPEQAVSAIRSMMSPEDSSPS